MKKINNEKYWEYPPITAETTEEQSYYKTYTEKCYFIHVVYKSGKSYNHFVPKSVCKTEDGKLLVPDWTLNKKKEG